jgi:DNA-binding PadR family transcriptional regulator
MRADATVNLPTSEFATLHLLAEKGEASGYELDGLVEERGFREWAALGTSSIYSALKSLGAKGLARSRVDAEKSGKGPPSRMFSLTPEGERVLRAQVAEGLSSSSSADVRFSLALAAMPVLTPAETLASLATRQTRLGEAGAAVARKFDADGGQRLPVHVRLLFRHSRLLIDAERRFTREAIQQMKHSIGGSRHEED